jgi:hypothetical protein
LIRIRDRLDDVYTANPPKLDGIRFSGKGGFDDGIGWASVEKLRKRIVLFKRGFRGLYFMVICE